MPKTLDTKGVLEKWLNKNKRYPTREEKQRLSKKTTFKINQIENWFANRNRKNRFLLKDQSKNRLRSKRKRRVKRKSQPNKKNHYDCDESYCNLYLLSSVCEEHLNKFCQ